jgi:hypothetical protein
LNIVRRKPAAHALDLQIRVKPFSKLLVFRRITDEAGVELNRLVQKRRQIFNELVGQAATAKESERERAGKTKSSMIEGTRSLVDTSVQSLGIS